jgi:hypothetical protein
VKVKDGFCACKRICWVLFIVYKLVVSLYRSPKVVANRLQVSTGR